MAETGADSTNNCIGTILRNEKNLVVAFIQFLRQKVHHSKCLEDQIEAFEVAIQCLESAFGLSDECYAFQPSKPLIDVFKAAEALPEDEVKLPAPTAAEIAEANRLKEEGNALMRDSHFDDAVSKYNEAIKLNREPGYFCNRAAAYCRLEQYDLAVQDCRTALALDPMYSKAYGRMGLALSCQNRYEQAVEVYKKAVEVEPNQESYRNNLKIAEEKLQNQRNGEQLAFGQGGASGLPNMSFFNQFVNNPSIMDLASRLLSDTNVQNMMTQLMGNISNNESGGGQNINTVLQAGQMFAQQLESTNPELIENLIQHFQGANAPGQPDSSQHDNQNDEQQPPQQ